jgi:lysophospholipase L1-like esterase
MAAVLGARLIPRETLGARLRRLAGAARFNNPYVNGVMAAPPTVTATTALPAGQTVMKRLNDGAASPMRTFGGIPTPYFTFARQFPVVTLNGSGAGGNIGGGKEGNTAQMEVMADAAKVTFSVFGSTVPHRFLVQSDATGGRLQYVDTTGTAPLATSGANYITLDFGWRALRRVVIESQQGLGFDQVAVGATESLFQTDGTDLLRGVWLTDSYGATVIGGRANDNFANVMGAALGIRDRRVSALASTGWLNNVGGTRYTIGQRIAVDAVPQAPDVGFIFAGINDGSATGIQAEVTTRVREWRAALPSVPLFVFGAWPATTGPSATVIAVENAITAAVAAVADPLTIFIPISTDPTGSWFFGTGRVGASTGAGNTDLYFPNADPNHPNTAGHLYAGLRGADAVMSKLDQVR